jgi:NAD(P)-dependent dehydrogenase (short-subunit alcohol dehydrogenase family)/acyl carrier protein
MSDYEIGAENQGQTLIHSQGKIIFQDSQARHGDEVILDIQKIKNRCPERINREKWYELFGRAGTEYGLSFKVLKEFAKNDSEALSCLELTAAACPQGSGEFALHPAIMDGALQTVMGLLGQTSGQTGELYLPFSLREIEIYGELPSRCYAYVTYSDNSPAKNGLARFDIRIADENGRALVRMEEFTARAYQKAAPEEEEETVLYFKNEWVDQNIEARAANSSEKVLAFADDAEITGRLTAKGCGLIQVSRGKDYRRESETRYEINPENKEDYQQLISDLKARASLPSRIVYLWGCEAGHSGIDDQLSMGVYSLFHLSQALMESKIREGIKLIYVYQRQAGLSAAPYGALSGFARTLRLEDQRFSYKTVELSGADSGFADNPDLIVENIIREFEDENAEVRYEGKKRRVKVLRELKPDRSGGGRTVLRENGVYLITGGMGGLGLIFAEYLLREKRGRVILAGRSELNGDKRAKLRELAELSGEIEYIKADITKAEEADRLFGEIRAKYGKLNGIIHSAGVIKDALVLNKNPEEVKEVLEPKVKGTLQLEKALGEGALDFVALFSSASAVTGNIGQSDYAYANGFMDKYAEEYGRLREKGEGGAKVISINWPLWKEGGMKVDRETAERLEKRFGLGVLETRAGLKAFQAALKEDAPQVIVVSGQANKIRKLLSPDQTAPESSKETAVKMRIKQQVVANLRERVETELIRLCAELLKVKDEDIDKEEELINYGLDSIMMISMLNKLEELYGETIEPNILAAYNTIKELAAYLIS